MHPNLIDAFYRFVASGSTSEPEIFWQGRNGPLLGKQVLEWSTVQTSLTSTGQRLAIWGDWSGFTIVDRFGAQIELIPHLFGATNRFPTGQRGILYIWRSSSGVTKPNALRLICSDLLLDHLRVPTGYPSAHIGGY
jgi:predicted phage gp36 major capsid-like protein